MTRRKRDVFHFNPSTNEKGGEGFGTQGGDARRETRAMDGLTETRVRV